MQIESFLKSLIKRKKQTVRHIW